MAVYKIFPSQDATLYSAYPAMNTGIDEILEASTNFKIGVTETNGEYPQASRFLVQFDSDEITYVSASLIGTASWAANLKLFVANDGGLSGTTAVAANAVAQIWNMGTGRYLNNPETQNGVSWIWRFYSGSNAWATADFSTGQTGSYNLSTNPSSSGGGVWWTGSQATNIFSYYSDLDLSFNVKSIVEKWNSGSWNNYGFIVRQTESQEFVNSINEQVTLKYFSRDTYTIYPPCLEFKWDDSVYNTGSLTVLITNPATILLAQNPGVFYDQSVNIFRVNARPTYPPKVWQTSSIYITNYALPAESYYAIKDLDTNEMVIDFDTTYTKLSCDASGSYFKLYMNGLEPERYYTVLIQTTIQGSTIVFDDNYSFKVVNG
jgi:hypothetical protein